MASSLEDEFLDNLDRILGACERCYQVQTITENEFDSLHRRLEYYVNMLEEISGQNNTSLNFVNFATETRRWLEWMESLPVIPSSCYSVPTSLECRIRNSSGRGRPSFEIQQESLEF